MQNYKVEKEFYESTEASKAEKTKQYATEEISIDQHRKE